MDRDNYDDADDADDANHVDDVNDVNDVNDWGESDESDDDEEEEEEEEEEESNDDEIVEKFIRTFHTGDFDAEFDDALSSDRTLMPPALSSARTTQASYIKPENWVERNRTGLEKESD